MTAQTILPANSVTGGYEVSNSLRGTRGDSNYLSRTFATGDRDKWTWSAWVKKNSNGNHIALFSSWADDDNNSVLSFTDDDFIQYKDKAAGSVQAQLTTTRKFRDVSAWYHIVLTYDSANGTAGNRIRLYINGVEETSFGTDSMPGSGNDSTVNRNCAHYIGTDDTNTYYLDCYLAEVRFVDGSALDPTSFGEFDSDSGIWKPINVSGLTNGTNGFYLEFKQSGTSQNSSGLGADTSGEDHHFAVTNFAATDQTTDTCTNNYCTINAIFADDGPNLIAANFTEGNVKMLSTVDGWRFGRGTFLLEAGKWYVEAKITENSAGQTGNFGIVPSEGGITLGGSDDNDVFEGLRASLGGNDTNLQKLDTGTGSTIFSDLASGDIAMLAIDLDNNKIWVGNDGTWYNNNNASTTLSSSNHDIALPTVNNGWVFGLGQYRDGNNNITWEYNWGNPSFAVSSSNADADGHGNFEFAVPSGFFAVNSKNLAEYG